MLYTIKAAPRSRLRSSHQKLVSQSADHVALEQGKRSQLLHGIEKPAHMRVLCDGDLITTEMANQFTQGGMQVLVQKKSSVLDVMARYHEPSVVREFIVDKLGKTALTLDVHYWKSMVRVPVAADRVNAAAYTRVFGARAAVPPSYNRTVSVPVA
jgi:hypothetical protein